MILIKSFIRRSIPICDLFLLLDLSNVDFAADTPYLTGENPKEEISAVENPSKKLMRWFPKIKMNKPNPDKFSL